MAHDFRISLLILNTTMKAFGILLVVCLIAATGCSTLQETAPPVSPQMAALGSASGISAESLEAGRRLMAMRCTSCHSLEPIVKYTAEEWLDIVDDMADRSGLDEIEEAQVANYLKTARATF